MVPDAGQSDRLTELTDGYDTPRLPVNASAPQAIPHAVTGRDVVAGLLPDNR